MSRPTVTIIGADGAASQNTHPLPNVFKAPIRADIVQYENSDSNTTDQAEKMGYRLTEGQACPHRHGQEQASALRRS